MIGVLVVSHGAMANEAINSAKMLVGEGEAIASDGVFPGDTTESVLPRLEKLITELDDGNGVVALVDLFGGTPNNVMFRLKQLHNVRILTGFNLPMILYVITERMPETTQDELVQGLLQTAHDGVREFGA